MNEEIKLIQYRLKRIVSSGTEHFIDLKIAQMMDVQTHGAKLADQTYLKNDLELIGGNAL